MTAMGGDPLAGIGEVAWEQLHHAYGPADDVPDQLRALRSPDPAQRSQARSKLFGNVYHQGTRWEASHAVVPFLAALVSDPTTQDRDGVLDLLTAIAIGDRQDTELPFDPGTAFAAEEQLTGRDTTALIRRLYAEDGGLSGGELEMLGPLDALWAAGSYHRTAGFQPVIAGWVADPDDGVAARAAALLPWLPLTPAAVAALLTVPAAREQARASASLALAHCPSSDPRIEPRLRELLECAGDRVAVTAAVALAYRTGRAIPDRAVSALIDASAQALPPGVTGWDRPLRGFVMLALNRLGLG